MGFPKQRLKHCNFQWDDACQPMILRWMSWTFLNIVPWIWISNCYAQIELIHPKVFAPTSEVITFEHLKRCANMLALRHRASAAKVEPRHASVVSRIWSVIFFCSLKGEWMVWFMVVGIPPAKEHVFREWNPLLWILRKHQGITSKWMVIW